MAPVSALPASLHEETCCPASEDDEVRTQETYCPTSEDEQEPGSPEQCGDGCWTSADPLETDLGYFRPAPNSFEPLPKGEFTIVKLLARGINGDVYKCRRCLANGQDEEVAVKRLKPHKLERLRATGTNERNVHLKIGGWRAPSAEDALAEVGVLTYLARQDDLPSSLLRLQTVYSHANGEAWVVTELCEGGELFAEIQRKGMLSEQVSQDYMSQILQAVAYLHKHHIAHRDVSLENILLRKGAVRLMDFGMAVQSTTASGTPLRYFRVVGKDYYRAPECHVPVLREVLVDVPSDASPGDVVTVELFGEQLSEVRLPKNLEPGTRCSAEVWGYAAEPADVWSTGVCLIMMLTGHPAWEKAQLTDSLFSYVQQHGLAELLRQWEKPNLPVGAQELIDAMTGPQSSKRPTAQESLAFSWLSVAQDLP